MYITRKGIIMCDYKEEWCNLGFIGLPTYEVSSRGRVKSLPRKIYGGRKGTSVRTTKEHFITPKHDADGYQILSAFNDNGKRVYLKLHRLVAMCFIPNCNFNKYFFVDHKNGIRDDNRVDNLRWVNVSTNNTNRHDFTKRILNGKKVNQYTLEGDLIRTWNYPGEIERVLGYRHSNIVSCCEHKPHRNTVYGYRWEYANNN